MKKSVIVSVVILLAVLGAWWVYDAALTPAEVADLNATPPVIDWENVVDDPSEKITISWYPIARFPSAVEGTYCERLLEERFNVEIKPIFVSNLAHAQRKPLMFAGGDIPDYFYEGDPIDVQRDVYHGCVVPVPRWVIKKYAPAYYRMISTHAPLTWLYADYHGQNWGIPTSWLNGGYAVPGVWRMDYLRKVGFDRVPETLEDFHEALRRITFDDPDGNGKDDTYGMSGNVKHWAFVFPEIFGAYDVLPFDWQEVDGRIVWGGIRPEAREVLGLLRDWYAEGLIDPEFVTDGMDHPRRLDNKFINGRIGYRYGSGMYRYFDPTMPGSLFSKFKKINPDAEMTPSAFPAGPNGHRGARFWGTATSVMCFGPGILEKPQKVIRILKMIEHNTTGGIDVFMEYLHGKQGVHWDVRVPDEGRPGTGPSSGIYRIPPYDDKQKFDREVLGGAFIGGNIHEYEDIYAPIEHIRFRDKYRKKEWCQVDVLGKPSNVKSAARYLADLQQLQLTVYAEIIRGDRPLDDFDRFAEDWLDRGGRRMTEDANELQERKKIIFEEVGAPSDTGGPAGQVRAGGGV